MLVDMNVVTCACLTMTHALFVIKVSFDYYWKFQILGAYNTVVRADKVSQVNVGFLKIDNDNL